MKSTIKQLLARVPPRIADMLRRCRDGTVDRDLALCQAAQTWLLAKASLNESRIADGVRMAKKLGVDPTAIHRVQHSRQQALELLYSGTWLVNGDTAPVMVAMDSLQQALRALGTEITATRDRLQLY